MCDVITELIISEIKVYIAYFHTNYDLKQGFTIFKYLININDIN